MANIKFSQFTVGNTESDVDFVVGYKGANNIQISPANLLAASLSGYLPLTGGTMSGDLEIIDNVQLQMGNGLDFRLYHDATNSIMSSGTGDLYIQNTANDKDIIFRSDDGAGGLATYFKLDGSTVTTVVSKEFKFEDNVKANFGTGIDLQLYHTGTKSLIVNVNGDLDIQNQANDGDILFKSDDGSGGVTTYMTIDGGEEQVRFFKPTEHGDGVLARFGNSGDLRIYHDGSNSHIQANGTGDLFIQQFRDDGNIVFQSDDGSGGLDTYFSVVGAGNRVQYNKDLRLIDNAKANFGSSDDLKIYHEGTDSIIQNYTGSIYIDNNADDQDIIFRCDDGSGGLTTYFFLDGSTASGGSLYTQFPDSSNLTFGAGNDLRIYHNGTNSNIENFNGALQFVQNLNDGDINFLCDNGSGGVTEYLRLDGGIQSLVASKDLLMAIDGDGGKLKFGASQDLQIFHNGTDSFIDNYTGNLTIRNRQDDGDIIFTSDDGSGGLAEYFRLDGSTTSLVVSASLGMYFNDGVAARFGTGGDLILYHDGSNSFIADTGTGKLKVLASQFDIINAANTEFMAEFIENAEVRLYHNNSKKFETTTDGVNVVSGTVAGSTHRLSVGKVGSNIGNQKSILELVENTSGSNMNYGFSFTTDGDSTNNLIIRRHQNSTTGATVMTINRADDNVTFAGNLKIQGISEYADNTAAIAAGLTTGQLYRTGDLLKIVH